MAPKVAGKADNTVGYCKRGIGYWYVLACTDADKAAGESSAEVCEAREKVKTLKMEADRLRQLGKERTNDENKQYKYKRASAEAEAAEKELTDTLHLMSGFCWARRVVAKARLSNPSGMCSWEANNQALKDELTVAMSKLRDMMRDDPEHVLLGTLKPYQMRELKKSWGELFGTVLGDAMPNYGWYDRNKAFQELPPDPFV